MYNFISLAFFAFKNKRFIMRKCSLLTGLLQCVGEALGFPPRSSVYASVFMCTGVDAFPSTSMHEYIRITWVSPGACSSTGTQQMSNQTQ